MTKVFEYKGLRFIEVAPNIFHSVDFGDKLVYEYKENKYYLIKDERISEVISLEECNGNPNSIFNNDYWWK